SFYFSPYSSRALSDLHSFPTRRSSDLDATKVARWFYFLTVGLSLLCCLLMIYTTDVRLLLNSSALPFPKLGNLLPTTGQQIAERSEEHTSELQSRSDLVCRLLLEKKKK